MNHGSIGAVLWKKMQFFEIKWFLDRWVHFPSKSLRVSASMNPLKLRISIGFLLSAFISRVSLVQELHFHIPSTLKG